MNELCFTQLSTTIPEVRRAGKARFIFCGTGEEAEARPDALYSHQN